MPSTEAQNEFGRLLDQVAGDQDIAITRHSVVRAVLVSAARYNELTEVERIDLDILSDQFDTLYAAMQTPEVIDGTKRGISATPEEMGRAAVALAQRQNRSRD